MKIPWPFRRRRKIKPVPISAIWDDRLVAHLKSATLYTNALEHDERLCPHHRAMHLPSEDGTGYGKCMRCMCTGEHPWDTDWPVRAKEVV